jgi:hypothetical protein
VIALAIAITAPISGVMLQPEDNQPSATRHASTKCVRTEVYRYLYAARFWMVQLRCPECGLTRWINLNPKGKTVITCNGDKMQVAKDNYQPSLEPCFERTAI